MTWCLIKHKWSKLSDVAVGRDGTLYQTRYCFRCRKLDVVWLPLKVYPSVKA